MNNKLISCIALLGIFGLGYYLGWDTISLYINPLGLIVVVGGTVFGAILAYPLNSIRNLWTQILNLRQNSFSHEAIVQIFAQLTEIRRKEGVRSFERAAQESGNIFLETGVLMVADNRPKEEIRDRLEQEFDFLLTRRESELAILSLMGRLAPAFGLAGTVMGLISMLHGLNDPNMVAQGMSVALLTTFYGIMLANLIILPLERKLKEILRQKAIELTLIMEGVMGLALEDNKIAITTRLRSYRFSEIKEAEAIPYIEKMVEESR